MRRILFASAIATIGALAPTLALGGERQDKAAAEQIAAVLRDSGTMQNYAVGVKYKDGTVWLSGRVTSEQQMQNALQIVGDIDGVEQIVNSLSVTQSGGPALKQPLGTPSPAVASSRPTARNVSATSAVLDGGEGVGLAPQQATPADSEVPAGFHRLAPRHGHGARPIPTYAPGMGGAVAPAAYDQPHLPNYSWPSYAAYPNYAALTYPKQYSATAFPFIGPFYPYPQVPLGWRKVSLEWDDGWWFLDFQDRSSH